MTECVDCRGELDIVRRMLGALAEDELVAPSESLIERALIAFKRRRDRQPQRPSRRAALQFDSWTKMAPLGVRGTPQERQLLFSESEYDLDVQVVRDTEAETFTLRGQILDGESEPYGMEGLELHLAGDKIERYGLTDDLGRFNFSQLSPGIYSLHVLMQNHDIVLDKLAVEDSWAL